MTPTPSPEEGGRDGLPLQLVDEVSSLSPNESAAAAKKKDVLGLLDVEPTELESDAEEDVEDESEYRNTRAITYAYISALFADMNITMFVTFYPEAAWDRGLTKGMILAVRLLIYAPYLITAFFVPRFLQKYSSRKTLLVANIVQSIVALLFASTTFLTGHWFFVASIILRVAQGIVSAFSEVTAGGIVLRSVRKSYGEEIILYIECVRAVSGILGPTVGDFFMALFKNYVGSWLATCCVFAAMATTMAIFPMSIDVENKVHRQSQEEEQGQLQIRDEEKSNNMNENENNMNTKAVIEQEGTLTEPLLQNEVAAPDQQQDTRFSPVAAAIADKINSRPYTHVLWMCTFVTASSWNFPNNIMFPYLANPPYSLNAPQVTAIFMVPQILSIVATYISEPILEKVGNMRSMYISIVISVLSFFLFAPPKHFDGPLSITAFLNWPSTTGVVFWHALGLTLSWLAGSLILVPSSEMVVKDCESMGPSIDESSDIISFIINTSFTFGLATAPYMGTYFVKWVGYTKATVLFGYVLLLYATVIFFYSCRIKKYERIQSERNSEFQDKNEDTTMHDSSI